ncbi:MAG: hypothetical protein Kow0031_06580 [Anaerolineae bacterium]
MKKQLLWLISLLAVLAVVTACGSEPAPPEPPADVNEVAPVSEAPAEAAPAETPAQEAAPPAEEQPADAAQAAPADAAAQGQAAEAAPAEAPAQQAAPQPQAAEAGSGEVDSAAMAAAPPQPATPGKYGLIAGDINDGGFNQLAWEGMQRAAQELGIEVVYSQTQDGVDFSQNVNDVLRTGVDGVVALGFGLAPAVKAGSQANPTIPFLNIDFPSQTANDLGVLFSTDEPSFMAGYLAAGMSQTGVVCTFGGQQTPPVLSFMVGFENGVQYYNRQNGANVQLLGWATNADMPTGGEGRFIGNFSDEAMGRQVAEEFSNQGCDIFFPVAGSAGNGAAAVAQERGLKVIGVDADQTRTEPQYADVYLTSVLKKIDALVFEAIRMAETGEMEQNSQSSYRNNFIGTLANNGVGLAPFHGFDAQVPQQLKADLAEIESRLAVGSLPTGWPISKATGVVAAPQAAQAPAVAPQQAPQPEQAPLPAPMAAAPAAGSGALNLEALRNAQYEVEYISGGVAQLSNGQYSEPAAPGSAALATVELSDFIAFGDLTGDGVDDAAVILMSSGGGSGTFYDLVVMVANNGAPTQIASTFLGDRVQIQSLVIQNGQAAVNMITQGPGDSMANPTMPVSRRYELNLVEVEGEAEAAGVMEMAQPQGFAGTYTAEMRAASSPGRTVTLVLNSDNSVELSTDYQNGKPPIVETGTWQDNGDGTVTVMLTGRADGAMYNQPDVITFGLSGNELKAIAWDTNVYGSEGMTLTRQ